MKKKIIIIVTIVILVILAITLGISYKTYQDNEKERLSRDNDYEVKTDFHLTIEKATPLSIDTFIPKEFSLAYQDQEETAWDTLSE